MSIRERLSHFGIFKDFWFFLKKYKRWWLGPIVLFLVILSIVVVALEGSALAPFIYTLF